MIKNKKEVNRDRRRLLPGIILISLVASFLTFFLLLNIEKNMLSDYEKVKVWVASADLKQGLEISGSNLGSCFVMAEVPKDVVPSNAVVSIEELEGSRTKLMISAGSVVTDSMFTDEDDYMDSMANPIIAGCKADDLYQVVSGTLRKGDMVNIYTVSDELEEAYMIWANVLVYQVFDTNGNLIPSEDTTTAAARINLLIEEGNAEQFYSELHKGSLRMVKLWDS